MPGIPRQCGYPRAADLACRFAIRSMVDLSSTGSLGRCVIRSDEVPPD